METVFIAEIDVNSVWRWRRKSWKVFRSSHWTHELMKLSHFTEDQMRNAMEQMLFAVLKVLK